MNGARLDVRPVFSFLDFYFSQIACIALVPVVIVIVPIAIAVPAVAIFVPPAMSFVPAAFPCLVQFVARAVRLPAFPSVVLDGFVQLVIRLGNAPLATIVVFGGCPGCSREC
jgi:hypothetical protein